MDTSDLRAAAAALGIDATSPTIDLNDEMQSLVINTTKVQNLESLCTDVLRVSATFLDVKSLAMLSATTRQLNDLADDTNLKTDAIVAEISTMLTNNPNVFEEWDGTQNGSLILYLLFTGNSSTEIMVDDGNGVPFKNDALRHIIQLGFKLEWAGLGDFLSRGARIAALVNNSHMVQTLLSVKQPESRGGEVPENALPEEYLIDRAWASVVLLTCIRSGHLGALRASLFALSDGGRRFDSRIQGGDFRGMINTAAEIGENGMLSYISNMFARFVMLRHPDSANRMYCTSMVEGVFVAAEHQKSDTSRMLLERAYLRMQGAQDQDLEETVRTCVVSILKQGCRNCLLTTVDGLSNANAAELLSSEQWMDIGYTAARNGAGDILRCLLAKGKVSEAGVRTMFNDAVRRGFVSATKVCLETQVQTLAGVEAAIGEALLRSHEEVHEVLVDWKKERMGKEA